MSVFGEKLRFLREKNCLKQEDLAKYLEVSRATISKYESGDREPDINTVKALAKFYSVPVDFIFGLTDFTDILDSAEDKVKENELSEYLSQNSVTLDLKDDLSRLIKKIIDNKLDIKTIENIIDNIILLNEKHP